MRNPTRSRLPALATLAGLAAAVACGLVGCATPTPSWYLEQGEQYLAAGQPLLALHYSEEALQAGYAVPSDRALGLHVESLRALGRQAEAEAFLNFSQRYAAGEDTRSRANTPFWRDCLRPESENEVGFRRYRYRGLYEVGTLAATFQVHEDGRIDRIRVLRAEHPAAAWLMIALVGDAVLPPARIQDFRDAEKTFPLDFCVLLDPTVL